MTGWILVDGGNHRCEECGNFINVAWLYFDVKPLTYTHCLCITCADDKLALLEGR